MNDNQEPKKKPGDIVAEEKLKKWLKDIGLNEMEKEGETKNEICD